MKSHRRAKSSRSRAIWVLFWTIAIGCENPPPTNLGMMDASSEFVVADSELKSDWEFAENEFVVALPLKFRFSEKASREKIQQSLRRIDSMPSYTVGRPVGVEEKDYVWLSRFTERIPKLQWIAIKDQNGELDLNAFCLDALGERLVTVGTDVTIWNASNGAKQSSVSSAISDCKHVFFDTSLETVYVANDVEIVRQKLSDGGVVGRWKPMNGPIVNVVKARDTDVLAAVTKNGVFEQKQNLIRYQTRWNSQHQKSELLRGLLEGADPTPACFAMALYNCGRGNLLTDGDGLLQTCVEKWPTCSFPHRVALELMINESDFNSDECYAYLSLLPKLLPTDHPYRKGLMASVPLKIEMKWSLN